MNIIDPKQVRKCLESMAECAELYFHQPGLEGGHNNFVANMPKTCPNLIARLFADNPSIRQTSFEEKCPDRTSKIALVVDEDEDYHFLRQDSNGWWSQKGGAKPVTNRDASDRPIWQPSLADNNWTNSHGPLNYDIFCGYLCVPRVEPLKIKTSGGARKTKKKRHSASRAKNHRKPRTTRSAGRAS